MDVGGKRWPTQRCGAGPAQDNSTIINRIMLRYRPIAPKPVTDGSVPGGNKVELVTKTRAKRKYVRVNKNRRKCKNNKDQEKEDLNSSCGVDQMTVLPGISRGRAWTTSSPSTQSLMSFSVEEESSRMMKTDDKSENINNDNIFVGADDDNEPDRSTAVAVVRSSKKVVAVESWLVVEGGMSEAWVDVGILGNTDRERMRNLEKDTCPGVISDSFHRVQWVNLAYRKMVNREKEEEEDENDSNNKNNNTVGDGEVVVWLVVKEKIVFPVIWPVFACTVRVIYTWRKEEKKQYSQTMPCDVWKMDFGGYAWRLDAKAALSLGR